MQVSLTQLRVMNNSTMPKIPQLLEISTTATMKTFPRTPMQFMWKFCDSMWQILSSLLEKRKLKARKSIYLSSNGKAEARIGLFLEVHNKSTRHKNQQVS